MTDYTKMSTEALEEMSSQLQHEEYLILKELLKRATPIEEHDDDVQPADMQLNEEDF